MKYSIPITEKIISASGTYSVSTKAAIVVCRNINRKKFMDAKKFAEALLEERVSIRGKYYTSTVRSVLELLNNLENNAKNRSMDFENTVLFISAHQGPKMLRGRTKRFYGLRMKSTHLQAVLKPAGKTKKNVEGNGKIIKSKTKEIKNK